MLTGSVIHRVGKIQAAVFPGKLKRRFCIGLRSHAIPAQCYHMTIKITLTSYALYLTIKP